MPQSHTDGETINLDAVPGVQVPTTAYVFCSTVAPVSLGIIVWAQPQQGTTLPKPKLGQT